MILLYIILLFLFLYFIFFLSQSANVLFKGFAPFISTDRETIRKVISEGSVKGKSVVYELGCGRARFLRIIEKSFPDTRLIGVENLFSLYLLNRIRLQLQNSRIKLLNKDFFTLDLKDADLIYCYLNNQTMERLGTKFTQECRPGTQIISRAFPIPQFKPEKVAVIKNKKIYFYKIN